MSKAIETTNGAKQRQGFFMSIKQTIGLFSLAFSIAAFAVGFAFGFGGDRATFSARIKSNTAAVAVNAKAIERIECNTAAVRANTQAIARMADDHDLLIKVDVMVQWLYQQEGGPELRDHRVERIRPND